MFQFWFLVKGCILFLYSCTSCLFESRRDTGTWVGGWEGSGSAERYEILVVGRWRSFF